jgi:hypothetical protein
MPSLATPSSYTCPACGTQIHQEKSRHQKIRPHKTISYSTITSQSHDHRTKSTPHDFLPFSDELPNGNHPIPEAHPSMQSLDIQGFSYEERNGFLPTLASAFADCGGWILDRKTLSPSTMEFRIEIQLRAVIDLYSSIIASGLELTRSGHLSLTHLCTWRKNLSTSTDLGQIVTIRIEISFLEDATLQSLLAKPPA